MEGRNKKLLLSLLVLVLLVSIGKETYALFTNEVSSIVQSYGTGTLKLSYSNTSINLDNAYPMTDTDGMNQSDNTITITNIGTLAYKFNVILDPSSDSTISSDLIRVSMDGENPATLSTDSNIIIRDVILNPGSSRTFTIKLWINSNTSSSDILNKKFSASLTSTGIAVKNMADSDGTVLIGNYTGPLYDYIKNNADTTTTIDFSKTSEASNTNGIYTTTNTDSGNPVYYYRGNVDNHVLFANMCWRIVRTTETGGVKLIYDGVPSNGQCNNTGDAATIGKSAFNNNNNDNAYVGYMFGTTGSSTYASTHTNTNDSTIKKTIDTWYGNNMTSYTSQLEDAVWCNDRSIVTDLANSNGGSFSSYTTFGYGTYGTIYGPTSRVGYNVSNPTPTLKCAQDNDKFTVNASNGNGALDYPVGLITADEMAYAGGKYYSSSSDANKSFYLYTGQNYWALSPFLFNSSVAYGFYLDPIGNLTRNYVTYSRGVRPSVSLQPGIEVTGGTGTATDPFVIAKPSLYDYIKGNADTTTTIDFSKTSEASSTNGIYTTTNTDSGNPVYYYRGNVDNRVIFANFCWRIVRTTETGGVKLIYDGVPSNGQCNNTGDNSTIGSSSFNTNNNDNAYVGYMFGTTGSSTYASTHTNTNDSTIKGVIDTWYHNNMTSYTSQLEDAVWCNDRSIVTDSSYTTLGYGTKETLYGPASRVGYRVSNPTPTLKCTQDNDKFTVNASNGNGSLTYPVGLITADEMVYAGAVFDPSNPNSSFYLYTGQGFWTLSPYGFDYSVAVEFHLGSASGLYSNVGNSRWVRPSVSLQPGIAMTGGGSGTAADPFVIG